MGRVILYPLTIGNGAAAVPTGWVVYAPSEGGSCHRHWPVSQHVTLIVFSSSEGIFGILFCIYKTKDSINCHT